MIDDKAEELRDSSQELASGEATGVGLRDKAAKLSANVASMASHATVLVGDLNGDGKVDEKDAKLARDHAAGALFVVSQEAGKLAKAVVRSPLTKDVATYAAVGAAIAIPLPIVGPAIGAAVGAGLGLWRSMTRHEGPLASSPESSAPPKDPITELERLHELKEKGIITDDEFLAQKRKLFR